MWWEAAPYAAMTVKSVSNAGLLVILRSALSGGVNPVVLVVYQQLASASLLLALALLLSPPSASRPSPRALLHTCLIACLQIPLAELLLTASLRYITATVQSVGLTTIPLAVFLLAVFARRESFSGRRPYAQAKLGGVLASAAGATLVVLASRSDAVTAGATRASFWTGVCMVAAAVLALSLAYLLVVTGNSSCIAFPFLSCLLSSNLCSTLELGKGGRRIFV